MSGRRVVPLASALRAALAGVLAGLLAGTAGCAHRNPFEERREWQEGQAKAQAPVEVEREDRSWRAYRTARVRVYVDPAFTKAEGNATTHCTELFTRANDTLEPALGMHLELEEVRELPIEARVADLEKAMLVLARSDAGEDVDFVLALLGSQPIATLSFHDIGRANVLGRHIALRSMSNAEELRAIETYDALDAEERSRLYQQRKRHKEGMVLLHEIGHVLGALHTVARSEIMHPSYDKEMQGFAPLNLEIMRLVLSERGRPADERDFTALVAQLKARLQQAQEGVFIEEERTSYLASLDATLAKPAQTSTSQGASAVRAATGSSASNAGAAAPADLSALSDADRTRFAELDVLLEKRDARALHALMDELATRYPDSYAVQYKACELGMKLRLGFSELSKYCDRMSALAGSAARP